jgi:hypothetical protein
MWSLLMKIPALAQAAECDITYYPFVLASGTLLHKTHDQTGYNADPKDMESNSLTSSGGLKVGKRRRCS